MGVSFLENHSKRMAQTALGERILHLARQLVKIAYPLVKPMPGAPSCIKR